MPRTKKGGPELTTQDHPNASQSAITATSITRRPVKGRHQRAAGWPQISRTIRFGRAEGRCECTGQCGSGHEDRYEARHGEPHPVTGSVVWLQTAHLDRNPWNSDPANLKAMCPKCHLAYDAANRAWTRAGRPDQQLELFPATGAAA
jgi:hypothetical protein